MSETFIIAIDFGTSFSGYAYSLTPTRAKTEPHVKLWEKKLVTRTPKTPTCILFNENAEFLEFGYKARDKYFKIHKDKMKYYFFKDFKMDLYGKRISKELVIRDVNKKLMSALKVFSEALRFLKEDALKTIQTNTWNKVKCVASDFTWVLTVPAIWDVSARQFMREAAVQAGLVSPWSEDKLVIALEPEAASVWCKQLPSKGFIFESGKKVKLTTGIRYIVVDCGGGTIDITVHEVLEGGTLKELHKASGNDKGGQKVEKKFIQCLRKFFCDGLWEEYERDYPGEAQRFVEDFVYVRQAQHNHVYQLKVYSKFRAMVERIKKVRAGESGLVTQTEGINFQNDNIIISEKKMESIFHETLVHIMDSLTEILNQQSDIKYILLVGGLSSSHVLHRHIQTEFGDQARVLSPRDPQEAVMKGAVLFGRDQSVISSRKSAYTYGYTKIRSFDPFKHKRDKKITNSEGDWCKDLFGKMVEIDEDVGWNESKEYWFRPLDNDQREMGLDFYRTERKNATYIDEWGMEGPVASCDVPMPDITKGINREVKLEVFFGSTEITAVATDVESKCSATVKMDFSTK